jgi:hypothetical protein
MNRLLSILFVAAIAQASYRPSLAAADDLRTVALSGDEAPGSGRGVSIDFVGPAFPLGDGLVGFEAWLRGPGIETSGPGRNDYAILSESNTGLTTIVQRGDKVPGARHGEVFGVHLIPIDPEQAGTSAIWADFFGSDAKHGVWHRSLDGGIELVAISGGPAPGFTDENIRIGRLHINDSYPVANGRNQIGFAGQYYGPGIAPSKYGLWFRESDGVIRLVARSGDDVPEMPANFIMGGRFQDLQLSDSGRIVLTGDILQYDSPERVGEFQRLNALLSETGAGTLTVVALEGQEAPGVEDGTAFETFTYSSGPALNRLGKLAFFANLTGGGQGLWTDRGGEGLTLIARRGDNAPGLEADEHLFGLGGVLSINDRNNIAFSASFTTGDGTYENGVGWSRMVRFN